MKFLLDECCTPKLVNNLREGGYDVVYVLEDMQGATDIEVLRKAYHEDRVLITEDKDFGELVYRLNKEVNGIILLRFSVAQRHMLWLRLRELLSLKGTELVEKFVVVDAEKFRIRPILSSGSEWWMGD
jgi:predicted nuclease of predicted toxin-antitoxin system